MTRIRRVRGRNRLLQRLTLIRLILGHTVTRRSCQSLQANGNAERGHRVLKYSERFKDFFLHSLVRTRNSPGGATFFYFHSSLAAYPTFGKILDFVKCVSKTSRKPHDNFSGGPCFSATFPSGINLTFFAQVFFFSVPFQIFIL